MLKRLVILLVLIAVLGGAGFYAFRPLAVEHTCLPDRRFAGHLEVSYKGLGGVYVFYDQMYAHISVFSLRTDRWGRTGLILQNIYIRFFPLAIGSTPPWCMKNMEDEVVGPGELLITAEADDGQPFCDYIFELQRLDGGEKFTISNLDSGGNTSVLQWDEAGVYAITFRSADGEVLCSYNLVYQPELGNTARCIVPSSYAEESKRDIITNP